MPGVQPHILKVAQSTRMSVPLLVALAPLSPTAC